MDPAASVLYLFDDPELGGTSFYTPRQSPEATDRIIIDSNSNGGSSSGNSNIDGTKGG